MNSSTSAIMRASALALTFACAGGQARTSPPPQQAPASTSTATAAEVGLARYVGTYQINPQVTAVIRFDGTRLVRVMNGEQQVLTPISDTRFRVGAGELEFETDQAGRVMMVLRHGTETMRIPRRR